MGRPGPAGAPSISVVPGRECLYFSCLAAAPPANPGESTLLPSSSGEFLYALDFCVLRLRSIQMIIPASARASGIPTAQPMMTPSFEFEPPPPDGAVVLAELAALAEGSADGVTVMTLLTVMKPAGPEETLTLVDSKGVADDEGGAVVAAADETGAEVFEGELPPEPDARPVKVATFGWFAA